MRWWPAALAAAAAAFAYLALEPPLDPVARFVPPDVDAVVRWRNPGAADARIVDALGELLGAGDVAGARGIEGVHDALLALRDGERLVVASLTRSRRALAKRAVAAATRAVDGDADGIRAAADASGATWYVAFAEDALLAADDPALVRSALAAARAPAGPASPAARALVDDAAAQSCVTAWCSGEFAEEFLLPFLDDGLLARSVEALCEPAPRDVTVRADFLGDRVRAEWTTTGGAVAPAAAAPPLGELVARARRFAPPGAFIVGGLRVAPRDALPWLLDGTDDVACDALDDGVAFAVAPSPGQAALAGVVLVVGLRPSADAVVAARRIGSLAAACDRFLVLASDAETLDAALAAQGREGPPAAAADADPDDVLRATVDAAALAAFALRTETPTRDAPAAPDSLRRAVRLHLAATRRETGAELAALADAETARIARDRSAAAAADAARRLRSRLALLEPVVRIDVAVTARRGGVVVRADAVLR